MKVGMAIRRIRGNVATVGPDNTLRNLTLRAANRVEAPAGGHLQ